MRHQQRFRVIVLLLLGAACLVAALLSGCDLQPGLPAEMASTDEGPLTASGAIQAEEIRLAAELGGRILDMPVEPGSEVAAGDVLVHLDASQLMAELAQAEAAVATAKADLAVVMAGPRPQAVAAAEAAVDLARARERGKQSSWQSALEAMEEPQQLDAQLVQARTAVRLAEQAVELAEAELAREELLCQQTAEGSLERRIADLQVQARREALAAAEADQRTAQTTLNRLWSIRNNPLGLLAQAHLAEGEYHIAETAVDVAEAELKDLQDGPTDEEIRVAQAAVDQAEAKASALQVQVAKFTLTSPSSGLVLAQAAYPGEVVAPAATILTVANLDEVILVVFVPANRIGEVRVGQPVAVRVDAFPEQTFAGRVTHLGDRPAFTPRNVVTAEERVNTFFEVKIALPNPDGYLKPGLPADALFD